MRDIKKFNAPEGAKVTTGVLIMVNHYWGRGETIEAAWKSVQKEKGGRLPTLKREPHMIYFVFHYIVDGDDEMTVRTYVNGMGALCYHESYPPQLIAQHKTKK